MGFRRFGDLLPPRLPSGYNLRTFQPGDEEPWRALLETGEFGSWDRARLDAMLAGARAPLPLDGAFFVVAGGALVGAACTFLHSAGGAEVAELGWVVVHPAHRGQGLALQMTRAVLEYVRAHGLDYCYLKTEEFRLPAIATYLRLGFEPEMQDDTQPERWQRIRASLEEEREGRRT
jgi:mycothiol synthase